ncbi:MULTISPECIES: hypothetical protein [unclassified Acinetobacter]|uniref:hypothetical protein n=1 Tax=unclassified Acinetobacter TaxID=196816 RepID=UPI0015D1FC04|nr:MULTISPECIES: hypothetical protein [unclassified Acinetobacter]UUS58471.1 hypothetical protein MST16_04615 [Acinetobacter sp. YH16040_T]
MNEIFWENYPSSSVKLTSKDDRIFLLFEGKSTEYGRYFSGKIELHLSLEEQVASGLIQYRYQDGLEEEFAYKLTGAFEDDSWEYFTGNWEENGELETFEALLEIGEQEVLNAVDVEVDKEAVVFDHLTAEINIAKKKTIDRHGAMRQRAARSDARVRKIQRSIELYYGLPQGSVRLVNPDKSIIHPSAKIGTLRGRWISEDA